MADVVIGINRVAASTSTGTQNITVDVGEKTSKAAIFIISRAITDNTAIVDAAMSFGFAASSAGSDDNAVRWQSEDNKPRVPSSQRKSGPCGIRSLQTSRGRGR